MIGQAGAGNLSMSNGATANTNGVFVANQTGSSGAVSINAATWTNGSAINIGNSGAGTLSAIASSITTDFLSFGNNSGSNGVATFAQGSAINCTNALTVGSQGVATMTIDSASTLTALEARSPRTSPAVHWRR